MLSHRWPVRQGEAQTGFVCMCVYESVCIGESNHASPASLRFGFVTE